ncbi:MAG: transcription antitermination factor NusB, partial [Bacteroidia bacterium]|nr:transcription antitermination factor NusB [Bacteroidia bacterium]
GLSPEEGRRLARRILRPQPDVHPVPKDGATTTPDALIADAPGEAKSNALPAPSHAFKKRPLTRREIRTKILQATYAVELGAGEPDEVFARLLAEDYRLLLNSPEAQDDAYFFYYLYYKNLEARDQSLELIRPRLENWDIRRVALIDRIILRLGICELLYFEDIPVRVTINEYIELAKTFGTDRSGQFVNGLLDAVYHDLLVRGQIVKTGRGLAGARSDELPFLQGRAPSLDENSPGVSPNDNNRHDAHNPHSGFVNARSKPFGESRPKHSRHRHRNDRRSNAHANAAYEPRPEGTGEAGRGVRPYEPPPEALRESAGSDFSRREQHRTDFNGSGRRRGQRDRSIRLDSTREPYSGARAEPALE